MATYRIVCTEQTGCSQSGHIMAVGTSSNASDYADRQWTVQEVWDAIAQGDVFYTSAGGYVAGVNPYRCGCGWGSLRSTPDATTANNLDSMRLCQWRAA